MKLFLVRHGCAENGLDDAARPLSERGIIETKRMADLLIAYKSDISQIIHSPYLRAQSTAKILSEQLSITNLITNQGITPSGDPTAFEKTLNEYRDNKDIMVVSHLPFIPNLLCTLCGLNSSQICFSVPPSSCTIIEFERKLGWHLIAHMTVNDL